MILSFCVYGEANFYASVLETIFPLRMTKWFVLRIDFNILYYNY